MAGQGSGGNVIAAIASFIIPGLWQLAQGRALAGLLHFIIAVLLWFVLMGWVMGFISAYDAAKFNPPRSS